MLYRIPLLLIISAVVLLSVLTSALADDSSSGLPSKSTTVEIQDRDIRQIEKSASGVVQIKKQLDFAAARDVLTGRIELINKTGSELVMSSSRSSCGCLEIQYRTGAIAADSTTILQFRLVIGQGLSVVHQEAIIDCEGEVDQLRIEFVVPVKDVAIFTQQLTILTQLLKFNG